jgi:CDP-diacylglycerol--glycerol-3-phosphate 3-phosphatidyltransferase
MFDRRLRPAAERRLAPVGARLRRMGLRADHLTLAGLLVSVGCAVAVADGHLLLGAALLAASALPDVLDGAVAKASGTASPRGAFFDSVTDRVSDSVVLGGVAWYLASTATTGSAHLAVLPMAVMAASNLISYERARAESLGFSARGGLMERAERMLALGTGMLFPSLLVPVLWLMLGLTALTATHRFVMVWRQGSGWGPAVERERRVGRRRDWRPTVGFGFGPGRVRGGQEQRRWRARRASSSRTRAGAWRRVRARS